MPSLRDHVLVASASRDRVSDAVKALALGLVILGHGLAWTTTASGSAVNTLDAAPGLFPITWLLQILPLFFLVAGDRMRALALDPTADGVRRRVSRLVTPTLPLLLVTLLAAAIIPLAAGDMIASAAGLIPVQLLWFLGVYLAAIALCPLLIRIRGPWHFAAMLLAIGAVDLVRIRLWEPIGWVNLLLAWLFFVALGMRLPRLRRVGRGLLAASWAAGLAGAIALVVLGPYSAALISTDALPGISNLAPPTIVLVLVGISQVSLLLLVWPALARLLTRDSVWVPVAVLSSRAMGVYLLHMLVLAAFIGVVILAGLHPNALTLDWWVLHAVTLTLAAALAWLLAPPLMAAGSLAAAGARRLMPRAVIASAGRAPAGLWLAVAGVAGLALLLVSESGVGSALKIRLVQGVPYLPAGAVILLLVVAALAWRAPEAGRGSGTSGSVGRDRLDGSWKFVGAAPAGPAGVSDTSSVPVTLEIAASRASGLSGVNRYMSTITTTPDGAFAFGPIGSTMMAGPPAAMEAEQEYLRALENVTAYRITGNELSLFAQDTEILRYLRQ